MHLKLFRIFNMMQIIKIQLFRNFIFSLSYAIPVAGDYARNPSNIGLTFKAWPERRCVATMRGIGVVFA